MIAEEDSKKEKLRYKGEDRKIEEGNNPINLIWSNKK